MNHDEKEQIIRRLSQRFGSPAGMPIEIEESLQRLVHAGASRFGVRADEPVGFSACDLAPPLARMIDHTALKPETSLAEIKTLCDEARKYCFASVCINPCYVAACAEWLAKTPVAVCTVIGFPLGANRAETKAREAELAIKDGAVEIDMVLNIGMLKSAEYEYVEGDIRAVVQAGQSRKRAITKVILETALLTDEEKVIACVLAQNAGADFVKTSTGFSKGGATAADIALMRRAVGKDMGVKASGGIRSTEDAETMIAHGATRIGASASVAILKGLKTEAAY